MGPYLRRLDLAHGHLPPLRHTPGMALREQVDGAQGLSLAPLNPPRKKREKYRKVKSKLNPERFGFNLD